MFQNYSLVKIVGFPKRFWSQWCRRAWCARFLSVCLLASLLLLASYPFGGPQYLLRLPAKLICVCEVPEISALGLGADQYPYDLMIILMGDLKAKRVEAAAEYFKQGLAPRIQIVQPEPMLYEQYGLVQPEAFLARDLAIKLGVPEGRVSVMIGANGKRATSTVEEAEIHLESILRDSADSHSSRPGPRKILLVTDWYHTKRARWIFRRVFAESGITVDVAPARREWADKWWTDEAAFFGLVSEYVKWTHNFLKQ